MTAADDIRTRLDAIDAYCAAATEGPWWRREGHAEIDGQNYAEVLMPGPVACGSYCYGGSSTIDGDRLDADLAFIAAARTDLPAVVAALRDALADLANANERLDFAVSVGSKALAQVQAVEALCDDPRARYIDGMRWVGVVNVRTALATTEAGEES